MRDDIQSLYANLDKLERQRLFFPAFDQAMQRINQIHQMSNAGLQPRNLMIIGPSGAGKSSVLEEYLRHFPTIEEPEQRRIPVLHVEIKSSPTVRSVAEDILKAMGVAMAYRGTVNEKTDRVVISLKKFQVELLMLDEVQHLLGASRRSFGSNNETEWLKTLLNLIDIPVVLSGLSYADALLGSNEQLRRRLDGVCHLSPFSIEDDDAAADFAGVVNWFDGEIHEGSPIGLCQGDMLTRLFYASNGLIGYLSKLLVAGLEIQLTHGCQRIEQWMLEQAFSQSLWTEGIGPLNPFNKHFCWRPLNKSGELFAPTAFTARSISQH